MGDDNTDYDEEKHRKDRLRIILAITLPTFVTFFIINLLVISIPNSVSLFFDGTDSKYSTLEGTLRILISNEGSENNLHISTTKGNANLLISSSNLYNIKSNNSIESNEITFEKQVILSINNVSSNPKDVNVVIKGDKVGLFQGTLNVVSQNSTFIPIAVDIKPDFTKVAIWAINGIVASVVALNAVGYWFLERRHHKTKEGISEFLRYLYYYIEKPNLQEKANIGYTGIVTSLDRIICILEDSNPNFAHREFKNLMHSYCKIYNLKSLKSHIESEKKSLGELKSTPNTNLNFDFEKNRNRILSNSTDFSLRRYTTTSIIEKNVISGIIGVVFGIIIGFIPFVQSDYVSSIRALGPTEYLILFGLGIGIGNLNEGISKIWEKPKDSEEK